MIPVKSAPMACRLFSHCGNKTNGYSGIGFGLFPTGGVDYKYRKIPQVVSDNIRWSFRVASPVYYNYGNVYFPDSGFSAL